MFSWGGGTRGQLGHGTLASEDSPRLIMALDGMKIKKVNNKRTIKIRPARPGHLSARAKFALFSDTYLLTIYNDALRHVCLLIVA